MLKKRFFKTKNDCEVTFEFAEQDANEVALIGDFGEWKPMPMKRAKKAGSPFRIKVRLPLDAEFQFRYFVNQCDWTNDTEADAYLPNEYGGSNSVVKTFAN